MNAAAFLVALGVQTRFTSTACDPLAEARRFLAERGETAEGRALSRVIEILASGVGEFSESEVWLFGTETRALIAALVNARIEGLFYSEADWRR